MAPAAYRGKPKEAHAANAGRDTQTSFLGLKKGYASRVSTDVYE